MSTESLIDRLSATSAALMARTPVQPARDFPLVLRASWRRDQPNLRLGRLRALAYVATCERTARPAAYAAA